MLIGVCLSPTTPEVMVARLSDKIRLLYIELYGELYWKISTIWQLCTFWITLEAYFIYRSDTDFVSQVGGSSIGDGCGLPNRATVLANLKQMGGTSQPSPREQETTFCSRFLMHELWFVRGVMPTVNVRYRTRNIRHKIKCKYGTPGTERVSDR